MKPTQRGTEMNAFRTWICTVLALLLVACGGGGSEPDAPATVSARAGSAVIGTAGGAVDAVLEGGATVRLDVPAGAFPSDATVRIDPLSVPPGQLGSFTLSAGDITLRAPVKLTVTLPAAPAPDPDTILLMNSGIRQVPVSAQVDLVTRTLTVDLPMLGSVVSATAQTAPDRARAQASSISTISLTLLLAHDPFRLRVNLLDLVVSDLKADGSVVNATNVQLAMASLLGRPAANTDARIRDDIGIWRDVVCAQQDFSVSALNSFNGVAIPTFTQLAQDVLQWDRFAQDLGDLVARVSGPAEPGCANVPADFAQPVRDRLPAFLAGVTADLDLLDPNVFSPPAPSQAVGDFEVLYQKRSAELFDLAGIFAAAGADDLRNLTIRVVTGQLDRTRNIAYSTCRSTRNQELQAKLLGLVQVPNIASAALFDLADLWSDIQFCGMPLHWKVIDANGAVLQQGDAGGIGPGFTTISATLKLAGAAKIVLSGPLAALICPNISPNGQQLVSQNNEQLVFSSGPLVGPATNVQTLTPSGTNQYLQSGSQDFDVATLMSQGAAKLAIGRQGAVCAGAFPGLTAHDTISTLVLDASSPVVPVQITAASLPATAVGLGYSARVTSTGGSAPFTWTASGLPSALVLNTQTGVVNGVVTTPGSYTIAFGVTSADGSSANVTLTLDVVADVAGKYAGTVTDNVFGGVNPVNGSVLQSKNLVLCDVNGGGLPFFLFELAPGGSLTFIGLAGKTFVADALATQLWVAENKVIGQFAGTTVTLRFTEIIQGGPNPPGDHTYVLTKQ